MTHGLCTSAAAEAGRVKWFQVDADTPNDPKIRALVRELGAEGLGALFLLWCHIADHGSRKPGWSLNAAGKPMPVTDLVDASTLTDAKFRQLVSICVSSGHFLRMAWEKRKVIAIPAMSRRADTYTKRRVRTVVEPTSKSVRRKSPTVHTKHTKQEPPVVPLEGGRITRAERREAERIRSLQFGCQHQPRCASVAVCVQRIVTDLRSHAS